MFLFKNLIVLVWSW